MSGTPDRRWRLFVVSCERRQEAEVVVVARDPKAARRLAEEWFEGETSAFDAEIESCDPKEIEPTEGEVARLRREWGGPPVLDPAAPEGLDVDLGPELISALEEIQSEALRPGTREYQEELERQGQLRMEGA